MTAERSRRPPLVLKALGVVALGGFLATAFTPLANLLSGWTAVAARLEPADAIVVLGGGLQTGRLLTDSSLRRAVHGVVLARRGLAPLLVFSGPPRGEGEEAAVRAAVARDLGVAPATVLTEAGARTTRQEASRLRLRLHPAGVRRVLERAGFEVLPAPVDQVSPDADGPEQRLWLAFTLALVAGTSLGAYWMGARRLRLSGRSLVPAVGVTLEYAGLALLFFAVNLGVGMGAILGARAMTGRAVSLYLAADITLPVLSALQAVAFQWCRECSKRRAPPPAGASGGRP